MCQAILTHFPFVEKLIADARNDMLPDELAAVDMAHRGARCKGL